MGRRLTPGERIAQDRARRAAKFRSWGCPGRTDACLDPDRCAAETRCQRFVAMLDHIDRAIPT